MLPHYMEYKNKEQFNNFKLSDCNLLVLLDTNSLNVGK